MEGAFVKLNTLTLPALYIYACVVHVPPTIKYINKYSTRHENNLYPSVLIARPTRTQTGSRYFGIKFFNVLPLDMKNRGLKIFKTKFKSYLGIQQFTISINI